MKTLFLIPLIILMIASCGRDSPAPSEVKHELSLRTDGDIISFDELVSADYLFYNSGDIKGILFRFDESDASRLSKFTSKHVGNQVIVRLNEHQLWKAKLLTSLSSSLEVQLDSKLVPDIEQSISAMCNGDIGRVVVPDISGRPHDNAQEARKAMLEFFSEE